MRLYNSPSAVMFAAKKCLTPFGIMVPVFVIKELLFLFTSPQITLFLLHLITATHYRADFLLSVSVAAKLFII